jgi:F0F1-type ATP synthase assembly protein I
MAEAVREPMPIRGVSRTAAAVADVVEDSIAAAKRIGKDTSDAAEQLMDDTSQRIKRHPVETVVGAFGAGIMLGAFLGWLTHRCR